MSETFEANQPMNSGGETASSTATSALKSYREGKSSKKPFTQDFAKSIIESSTLK